MHAKSLQSCPTLCNPMDHSPPGFSVHGILQARILEGVAMPSSSKGNYLNIIKSIYEKPTANIIFNKERLIICTRVLHLLQHCFCSVFWFLGHKPCGILAFQQGVEPAPPALGASQVALVVKNPAVNAGDTRDEIWSLGWEDPWTRAWQPTPVFLPGESHGRRSLVGYSP